MKSQMASLIGSGIALALALTACGAGGNGREGPASSTAESAPVIDIGSLYEPQNLDNVGGGGQGVIEALGGNVYEGLFRLTDDGTIENLLAADYKVSRDGLTYTFYLHEGVRFHSGDPLTGADVEYSLERIIDDGSTSPRKSALSVIKSIETPGTSTVVVKLSSRSISFVYNLSHVWIINDTVKEPATAEDGTGPYRLGTWKRGSSLCLDRFDGYWGAAPKNRQVVFHYFTDASALNNALLTGTVDLVTSEQSPDALAQFTGDPRYKVSEGRSTTKLLLAFNDREPPFDKVLVRKAVSSAIDDGKLLESIWDGHGSLIGSMVPPSDPWYEDLTEVNPYDVELARRQLAEAGYPEGFTFTLDTPNYDPHPTIATFVKSELAKVGITVDINTITADEWYTKVYQRHDFTATLQEHVNDRDIRWYGDPDFYWGYDNPQVATWIKQSEEASTLDGQTALLRKASRQIAEDAASDWLYLNPQIVVSTAGVSGYPVNGLNAQFYVYGIDKR
ncbi:ABC transporter substrate-binding protein [Streptosporangium lutulentum]|uniref:Peptide/nickel transport system substrate-binding protein n=1 Tax=Streptosporangium lutulentum TaxID=1461250 RepID=A0ABT9Q4P6_9ACTN|nr:ABC transporter substrate-binding protein [Streptosporangium lutulentum]MDP9841712.1 peptide/nickel transport system substrate-binding protein [Streptosporangium lutulentum]